MSTRAVALNGRQSSLHTTVDTDRKSGEYIEAADSENAVKAVAGDAIAAFEICVKRFILADDGQEDTSYMNS